MQHEKRKAEHPERMLGSYLARLSVDVEPLAQVMVSMSATSAV
jgi:hypothetical protein